MRRWVVTLGFLAICAGMLSVFAFGFGRNPHEVPFGMRGQPAPSFVLRDLTTNKPVSMEELRGRPVVLNFWASWCGPCKMEHPYLEWGHREFGDQVAFVGMVFEDTPENARLFLSQYGASFPQLLDPNSMTAVGFGVAGVPETYFITADGTIMDKHVGPIPPQVLAENIRKVLAAKSSVGAATGEGSP